MLCWLYAYVQQRFRHAPPVGVSWYGVSGRRGWWLVPHEEKMYGTWDRRVEEKIVFVDMIFSNNIEVSYVMHDDWTFYRICRQQRPRKFVDHWDGWNQ